VILDESESVIGIIGSGTLKEKFCANLRVFATVIAKAQRLFVMDAYLSNRSIDVIRGIRGIRGTDRPHFDPKNTLLVDNEFQFPERTRVELGKAAFVETIRDKLEQGLRCVVVIGSKGMGDTIVREVGVGVETLYYNSENRLPLSADVNQLWTQPALLMYTPTISKTRVCPVPRVDSLTPPTQRAASPTQTRPPRTTVSSSTQSTRTRRTSAMSCRPRAAFAPSSPTRSTSA